jgi:hypothetical protein
LLLLLLLLQGEYAQGYGTVLDSGTTFTYLPTAAFKAFLGLLTEALQGKGLHRSSGADPQVRGCKIVKLSSGWDQQCGGTCSKRCGRAGKSSCGSTEHAGDNELV